MFFIYITYIFKEGPLIFQLPQGGCAIPIPCLHVDYKYNSLLKDGRGMLYLFYFMCSSLLLINILQKY